MPSPATGVFYHPRLDPLGEQPANTATWVNITGNLKTLTYSIFGQNYNPATDPDSIDLQPGGLAVLDRGRLALRHPRLVRRTPTVPTYHPVLYVGAGNSGGHRLGRVSIAQRRPDVDATSPIRPTAR